MKRTIILAMIMMITAGCAAGCGPKEDSAKKAAQAGETVTVTPAVENGAGVSATPVPKANTDQKTQTASGSSTANSNTSGSSAAKGNSSSSSGGSTNGGAEQSTAAERNTAANQNTATQKPPALDDTPEEGWIPVTIYDDYGNSVVVSRNGALWYDENGTSYDVDAAADGSIIFDENGKQWYWQAPAVTSGEYYDENGQGFFSVYLYDADGSSVEVFREDGGWDWYDADGVCYGDVESADGVVYDENGKAWYFTAQ